MPDESDGILSVTIRWTRDMAEVVGKKGELAACLLAGVDLCKPTILDPSDKSCSRSKGPPSQN